MCNATGIPAPDFVWFKDSQLIDSDRDREIAVHGGVVEISSTKVQHAGHYVCTAVNKGGNSSVSITLDVHCKV